MSRDERVAVKIAEEKGISGRIDPGMIGDSGKVEELSLNINMYIHELLSQWGYDSAVAAKGPTIGKEDELLKQTKICLYPLLVKLRKGTLASDSLISLSTTLHYLQEYQRTGDKAQLQRCTESYMHLSMGSVAWPIGVSQVGIHERKINYQQQQQTANIMADEETRMWITSIKRIISHVESTNKRL
ncbi:mRNA splicing protein PRP18 [Nakaseomyces bracarensis]|uniref:mRNA splicing protein PRP18 n=1 Tax=Nakaseomyces bracarensis TaxID=273131 RepID=UPI003870F20F